jgi:hypothetical protein
MSWVIAHAISAVKSETPHSRHRAATSRGARACGDAPARPRRRADHPVDLRVGHRRRRNAVAGPVEELRRRLERPPRWPPMTTSTRSRLSWPRRGTLSGPQFPTCGGDRSIASMPPRPIGVPAEPVLPTRAPRVGRTRFQPARPSPEAVRRRDGVVGLGVPPRRPTQDRAVPAEMGRSSAGRRRGRLPHPARQDPTQHHRPVRREHRAPGRDRLRAAQRPAALGGGTPQHHPPH